MTHRRRHRTFVLRVICRYRDSLSPFFAVQRGEIRGPVRSGLLVVGKMVEHRVVLGTLTGNDDLRRRPKTCRRPLLTQTVA